MSISGTVRRLCPLKFWGGNHTIRTTFPFGVEAVACTSGTRALTTLICHRHSVTEVHCHDQPLGLIFHFDGGPEAHFASHHLASAYVAGAGNRFWAGCIPIGKILSLLVVRETPVIADIEGVAGTCANPPIKCTTGEPRCGSEGSVGTTMLR
jgi:hypothetical protein